MITKFSKLNGRELGLEITAALKAIGEKHGITIAYAGGVVADLEFVCKVSCKVNDAKAVETKQREDFNNICGFFGMQPSDFLKEVSVSGKILRLVGFTSRTKYPVRIFDVTTGKEMLYGETVLRHFGRKEQTIEELRKLATVG